MDLSGSTDMYMFPKWYINEMDQVEEDYEKGHISLKEFNALVRDLDRELEAYHEDKEFW